jgi:ATP-dependent Clp endopeptidase proteolytic subunit ClpP
MRVPPAAKAGKDWFRIENKKNDKDEVVATDVYIYDEIGFWGTPASEFVTQLAAITSDKINLHLNSPGGEIFDGVAIYNALKGHHADVTVYIDALAASAASFIAQAGDEVKIARNATMMIHDGLAMVYGNAKDMHDTGDLLDKLSDNIADIYTQRAGGDVETWRNYMREEVWYNANEAVEAGLADEVFEVEAGKAPEDKFSLLNYFNHTGRDNAPSPESIRQRVFNRVKEARMSTKSGTPRNDEGNQPEGQNPEGQNPEGQNPDENKPDENTPNGSPPAGESVKAPAEVPVPNDPAPPKTENKGSFGVLINGAMVTDPAAVQTYINSLETAAKESRDENRKEFVRALAGTNRIAASQIESLSEFALDLSDKQYESWVASWDAAPSLSLLGDHAGTGNGQSQTPQANADADKLEVARGVVRQHKLANMAPDKIKETQSYKLLVAHDPEFKL